MGDPVLPEYVGMARAAVDAWDGQDTAELILQILARTGEDVLTVLGEARRESRSRRRCRPVRHLETGAVYPSVKALAAAAGVKPCTLTIALRRGIGSARGKFEYVTSKG
jgi:hypothetical protein